MQEKIDQLGNANKKLETENSTYVAITIPHLRAEVAKLQTIVG
jgi:hypothetical protein